MKYMCKLNGKEYEVEIERIDDFTPLTKVQTVSDAPVEVSVSKPAAPASEPKKETVKESAQEPATSSAQGEQVKSPMPGTILDINVQAGQSVNAGDVIVVMEAMKMENEIVASVSGKIAEICVKKGDAVDTDAVLAVIE